ncbi:Putative UDP-glucuronate:xylan alpha-glucuronosyltransferase 5 [Linum perenne]
MAFSRNVHHSSSSSNRRLFVSFLCSLSLILILIVLNFRPRPYVQSTETSRNLLVDPPSWLSDHLRSMVRNDVVETASSNNNGGKIRIGLVNVDDSVKQSYQDLSFGETVSVDFQRVRDELTWTDFFPDWVNEDEKLGDTGGQCPEVPMPQFDEPRYRDLDVVVVGVPCEGSYNGSKGIRDVFRLQVNLVAANLVVANGDRAVYVVFIGSCGPVTEIFRCDDMLTRVGDYWVYKLDSTRLKQKVSMPVGSCQIASPFGKSGQKQAYVTVLHSSESYICGAIALAQSIKLHNSTRDLILLHDSTISPSSLTGLREAGWTTRLIQPIRSTFAEKGSYNEWNYSKLRIWQLSDYDKVVFIDSDLLVIRNMDEIFTYPQLSASPNDGHLFNSGIMVIEPSSCMFEDLMAKSTQVASYNGGDQGFLNEVFTWWHRLPRKINWLRVFQSNPAPEDKRREPMEGAYGVHFLGFKPWMCYKDYDCNWDVADYHIFASDVAHKKWWEVYDVMPKKLQSYCGLSRKMDERIREARKIARIEKFRNGRWRIQVKDTRKDYLSE